MANKKRDKRRKIARKAILKHFSLAVMDPYEFDNTVTERLDDREFDAVMREISKATVVVTWKDGK